MQETLTAKTRFIASDEVSPVIKAIGNSIEGLNIGLGALNRVGMLAGVAVGLGSVAAAGAAVQNIFTKAAVSYSNFEQQELKLQVIMRQRMQATDQNIDSIHRLISAQSELGIIGGTVQRSGAQQLATFVTTSGALRTLIPAMNNLAVQMHGYSTTAEDMVGIGNMMGKVFTGQSAALRRVGISFSEAQEQLLNTLPEQERAALLAQIITQNVGKMNEAFAKTPEGQKVQAANALGKAWTELGKPIAAIKNMLEAKIDMTQAGLLTQATQGIAVGFLIISSVISGTIDTLAWMGSTAVTVVSNLAPLLALMSIMTAVYYAATAAIGIYTAVTKGAMAAMGAYKTIVAIATGVQAAHSIVTFAAAAVLNVLRGATTLSTFAQWALNAAMYACPVSWLAIGIAVLIGVIAAVAIHTYGLRAVFATVWRGIVDIVQTAINIMICAVNTFIGAMNTAAKLGNKLFGWKINPVQTIKPADLGNIRSYGDNIENGTFGDRLSKNITGLIPDISKIGAVTGTKIPTTDTTASQIAANTGKTAENTGRIADKYEMSDQEIQELRNMGMQKALLSWQQTHTLNLTINNNNNISGNTDIDGMTGNIVESLQAALAVSREGAPA